MRNTGSIGNSAMASRQFGLGAAPQDGNLGAVVQQALCCPMTATPVIEYTTITVSTPMSDTAFGQVFGPQVRPLSLGPTAPAGVASVDTSFAQPGLLQSNFICTAFGIHVFAEPITFTAIGNAVASSATSLPISPDAVTATDQTAGGVGSAYTGASSLIPAILEWGFNAWMASWEMANAYQVQWITCNRYMMLNELMADIAYFNSYAEGQGMGTSEVAVQSYVSQVNAQYTALNAGNQFIPLSHRRVGSLATGTTGGPTLTAATPLYHPTRDFDLVPVTWGGLKSQSGCCNPYRKFAKPVFLQTGNPLLIIMNETDAYHAAQFKRYMTVSRGLGTNTTALTQISSTLNGAQNATALGATAGLELSLDQGTSRYEQQLVNTDRMEFFGGAFKLAVLFKGFEVGGHWLQLFKSPQAAQALSQSVYMPEAATSGGVMGS